MKLLLIEDDQQLVHALTEALRIERIDVTTANDGTGALRLAVGTPYDLILLDLTLPGQDGDALLRRMRSISIHTPVIIISARVDIPTKVQLLELGADDYLCKPFSSQELVARIKAVLRTHRISVGTQLNYQDITLDLKRHTVSRDGKELLLREKEIRILEYFLMHPEQVLTREMIMSYVWGPAVERATNVVDVHIHYLRVKLDKPYGTSLVKTVSSVGYKLCK